MFVDCLGWLETEQDSETQILNLTIASEYKYLYITLCIKSCGVICTLCTDYLRYYPSVFVLSVICLPNKQIQAHRSNL
jgi:hypothetical protein